MKKYFMKESGEEIQFGDIIRLDLVKNGKDGSITHQHVECKFHPALVESLLEQDIIEVKDCKDNGVKIDFKKYKDLNKQSNLTESEENILNCIFECMDSINNLVKDQNEIIQDLEDRITELEGVIAELTEELPDE